jgi:hypothetical protein
MTTDWTEHQLLMALTPQQRAAVIAMVPKPHYRNLEIALLAGVEADLVQQVRRARRSQYDRERDHRRRSTPRVWPVWVPLTKPCPCEREGCVVVQRPKQAPSEFRAQKFATNGCSNFARRKPVARVVLPPPPVPKPAPPRPPVCIVPGPETFLDILRLNHPRGEGEPTRETIHHWAAVHSGKREWSTADMARLRAPTLVCTGCTASAAAMA